MRHIDVTQPSPARVYDAALRGNDNYDVDRAALAAIMQVAPEIPELASDNRQFLRRAVEHACALGIRQFLDLGSGLPTADNVHQIAGRAAPGSRVVYVDNDPTVLAHAQALLAGDPNTAYVQADARNTAAVLGAPDTRRLLDLSQPVAVLLVALLHFVPDEDDPAGIVAAYMGAVPSGSVLVISAVTSDGVPATTIKTITSAYGAAPPTLRTTDQIHGLFGGLPLEPPGRLVDVGQWPTGDGPVRTLRGLAGVARKP